MTRQDRYTGPAAPVSLSQARALVAPPAGRIERTFAAGRTDDIVAEVRAVFAVSGGQVGRLAAALQGRTVAATLRNVFAFVGGQVGYVLDPRGQQYIKTPAAVVHSGFADCKGLSILTGALLGALGIPASFRFAAYVPGPFTHVYVVAHPHGLPPIVLDTCLPTIGEEKGAHEFTDYPMTEIFRVSGHGADPDADPAPLGLHGLESEEEFELKLHRQGLQLERHAVAAIAGIGAIGALDEAVADYDRAIASVNNPDELERIGAAVHARWVKQRAATRATYGRGQLFRRGGRLWAGDPDELAGIGYDPATDEVGDIGRRKNKAARKAARKARKATRKARRGKLFKRIANKVKSVAKKGLNTAKRVARKGLNVAKKAGKFALKALTAPQRLLVKGIAEVALPKAAPFFLYLFVRNERTLAGLPPKVLRKRRKAERIAKFMTRVIGMKEEHFLKIVRNGIIRKYKATPEQVLAKLVTGPISGVGDVCGGGLYGIGEPVSIIMTLLPIIQKIAALFKQKTADDELPAEGDEPDLEADFGPTDTKARRMVRAEMETQPVTYRGEEPADAADHAAEEAEQNDVLRQVEAEPQSTPADADLPESEAEAAEEAENFNRPAARRGAAGKSAADSGDGDGEDPATSTSGGISPMVLAAAAGGLLLALK